MEIFSPFYKNLVSYYTFVPKIKKIIYLYRFEIFFKIHQHELSRFLKDLLTPILYYLCFDASHPPSFIHLYYLLFHCHHSRVIICGLVFGIGCCLSSCRTKTFILKKITVAYHMICLTP